MEQTDTASRFGTTLAELEGALSLVSDAIAWVDAEGRVTRFNIPFEQLIGPQGLPIQGTRLIDLLPLTQAHQILPPDTHPAMLAVANQASGRGRYEFQPTESSLVLDIAWQPLHASGASSSAVLVIRVTQQQPTQAQPSQRDRQSPNPALQIREAVAIRALYDITFDPVLTFAQRLQQLLVLGCEWFGMAVGIVSHRRGDRLSISADYGLQEANITKIEAERWVSQFYTTWAAVTLQEPIAVESVESSPGIIPPYWGAFSLQSGLAIPIAVAGDQWAVLVFLNDHPRQQPFTSGEKETLKLMAQWIGAEMGRQQAQESLQDREEQFRNLIHDLKVGVLLQGPNAEILVSNQTALTLLGLTRNQLLGKTSFDPDWNVIDEAGAPLPGELHPVPRAIASRQSVRNVVMGVYRPTLGDRVWLLVDAEPQLTPNGDVKQVVCTFSNITKQKQVEAALRESEQRFRTLVANLPGVVYRCLATPDWQDLFVSEASDLITGYPASDFLLDGQRRFSSIIHPDDVERVERTVFDCLEVRQPFTIEYRIIHADGSHRWLCDKGQGIFNEQGNVLYIDGVLFDITDRKHMETALQEREQQYRVVVENIKEVIFQTNANGQWTVLNPAWTEITGFSVDETIGTHFIDYIYPDDRDSYLDRLQLLIDRHQHHHHFEYRSLTKDGHFCWLDASVQLIIDPSGNVVGSFGTLNDITERKQIEDALRQSEARHRALLETIPDLIVRLNKDGVYLDCKPPKNFKMLFPGDQIIGKQIDNVLPLAIAQQRFRHIQHALETRIEQTCEYQLEVDGVEQYEEERVVAIGDDEALVIVRDITERKQIEAEAQRQNQQAQLVAEIMLKLRQSWQLTEILQTTVTEVQTLLNADRVVILRLLTDGVVRVVTEAVVSESLSILDTDITDHCFVTKQLQEGNQDVIYRMDDVSTMTLHPCFVHFLEQFSIKAKLVVPILLKDELWGFMVAHQCSKPRHWSNSEVQLLKQLADQLGLALSQAQLLDALRVSEEKFRNLVEQTHDWVWEMDNQAVFNYVNPKVRDILGYEPEAVIQQKIFDFMSGDEAKRFITIFNQLIATLDSFSAIEVTLLRKDGRSVILEMSGLPIRDRQGILCGYHGIARDITTRKQLEREMRKALAKEKELSDLKSRFIAMASHEFRTPLSAIMSSSELLEYYGDQFTEAERLEQLHLIQESVDWLTQLLEDVLLLGKAEAGKLRAMPVSINLSAFCRSFINKMQLTTGRDHVLIFNSSCTCPAIQIDEKLLRQILTNLLSNAIKYSPQGSCIQVELAHQDDRMVLSIQDHGIGIPISDQTYLFQSFHRATNVGTIQGTGLGLAIVKQCVDALQGTIAIDSQVGVGTTFSISLPIR